MKKILVIYYSQSGQLSEVVKQFTHPLVDSPDISVTFENVLPQTDYPFPWPFFRFFDTFPEAVYLDPPAMKPSNLKGDEDFDLIILAYQVWFLSPSLPITGFLKAPLAAKLFKDKPIVTLIACRDMWLMAQEEVKKQLAGMGAKLVGNVALVDKAGSIGSFLATPVWVLSGNKGPHLGGLIPRAGVADDEIKRCDRFGQRIVETLSKEAPLQTDLLSGLGAVQVNETLISSEKTARRAFRIWGKLLRAVGPQGSFKRKPVLLIYVIFLVAMIITVVPLGILIKKLFAPLTRKRIAQQKAYYGDPSGS